MLPSGEQSDKKYFSTSLETLPTSDFQTVNEFHMPDSVPVLPSNPHEYCNTLGMSPNLFPLH